MKMMDKVLVEIYIPAMNISYDMFIPLMSPMYVSLDLIKKVISLLSQGQYQADGNSILCHATGDILNINLSVHELGIHNGSKLMLI